MPDYQTPVDFKQLNDAYQDNTSKSIDARQGRQLLACASPFFFSLTGGLNLTGVTPGTPLIINKQVLDDDGNNNSWFINGFLVKQSENTYLIENVSGANLTCVVALAGTAGPFIDPSNKTSFYVQQLVPAGGLESFAGHSVEDFSFDGSSYWKQITDTIVRRFRTGGKLKLTFEHTEGTENDMIFHFRFMIYALGGWRGYSARFPSDGSNSDRGQDLGGIVYE